MTEATYTVHVDTRGEHPVVTVARSKLGTPAETFTIRRLGDLMELGRRIVYGDRPPDEPS